MLISAKPSSIPSSCSLVPRSGVRTLRFWIKGNEFAEKFRSFSVHPFILRCDFARIKSSSVHDLQRCKSNLESLFCYDKSFTEEDIEQPVGLSVEKKEIGNNPPCTICEVKGAVLCATCAGSGLYVDSILESQGIIVKVKCLVLFFICKVVEALGTSCAQNVEGVVMLEFTRNAGFFQLLVRENDPEIPYLRLSVNSKDV
ncbi:hypothetical protein C4D60_Mb04t28560 [Musa balbisiana]|uniref:Uncharacterized protein n=1 Tax=Musa balbisiana TaxID=52838 RepID=A0A4S8KFB2_MUSBA|nr:hypothetical protein C4D60_Mb04t28560 [Musa balbisiana]